MLKEADIRFLKEDEFEAWDEFVENSPQGSIFSKSYWLKAVSDEFKILVCRQNNKIIGGIALPSIYGKFYRNPKLTQKLGIILNADKGSKYCNSISKQMDIIEALIKNLPKFKLFDYSFSKNFTNFLPLLWNKFKVNIKYTYLIEDLTDLDKVYSGFDNDLKYEIKKAIKNNISIIEHNSIDEFYGINKKTFERQNIEIPYSLEFLTKLDKIMDEKKSRKILFAKDESNKLIAAVYLIYDRNCTYYLMGGADPEYRNTGVQKLLIWEAIKFASKVSKTFDFEGSMIQNIEKGFREFGGTQTIIHNVYRSDIITEMFFYVAKKNRELIRKVFKV